MSCLSRLVGVGEASFISLAAPFIDDHAPAARVCLILLHLLVSIFKLLLNF